MHWSFSIDLSWKCWVLNRKALLAQIQLRVSLFIFSWSCYLRWLPLTLPPPRSHHHFFFFFLPVITLNCFSAPKIIHAVNLSFVSVRKKKKRMLDYVDSHFNGAWRTFTAHAWPIHVLKWFRADQFSNNSQFGAARVITCWKDFNTYECLCS